MMNEQHITTCPRKHYYVSVQARTILEDREAAAYEFDILACQEEVDQLTELFEEFQEQDEAQALHFTRHPYGSASTDQMNAGTSTILIEVYKMLFELGTQETRKHIASMNLFAIDAEMANEFWCTDWR